MTEHEREIYRRGYRAGWEAGVTKAHPKGLGGAERRAEIKAKQEAWLDKRLKLAAPAIPKTDMEVK